MNLKMIKTMIWVTHESENDKNTMIWVTHKSENDKNTMI